MSRLTDLIAKAKAKDPQLGTDLDREFRVLSSRLPFGLNFERHSPEAVELPQRPIRKGDKVRVLAPRGTTKKGDQRLWQVKAIKKDGEKKIASLELIGAITDETLSVSTSDLVVVAEFRDTIYPGLISTGKVQKGGEKPNHTVINGENYHVLKALSFTHRGKVDAIYIDPPYNTGAKDWKYNNDYVEGDDLYRHSKWLAMMERRLLLARELLNPADSVLIVTIDEKEYLRLGMLLEQTFPEAEIQMVSIAISPSGIARGKSFRRSDEYSFFVMFGNAAPTPLLLGPEWLGGKNDGEKAIRWNGLMRSGTNARRVDRPNLFYPIFLTKDGEFAGVGSSVPLGADRNSIPIKKGLIAIWPIRQDGSEGNWQIGPDAVVKLRKRGYVKFGKFDAENTSISYLKTGEQKKLDSGAFGLVTLTKAGHIDVESKATATGKVASTQWSLVAHSAADHGSTLLRAFLPGRQFPFPKSLYAVEDSLRFFVFNKPEATILDFFSGSGTTAHAVMRLNRQDNGRRQCISVTNNEVAADEQRALRDQGLRPGDPEWEQYGICDYITKPRVAAAINGKTTNGEPIKGDYKFTDPFPMAEGFEENAEFFTLSYETLVSISHNRAFDRIAPLLWMRAGSLGKRIERIPSEGWEIVEAYGLLVEVDAATAFIKAVTKAKSLRIAYVVTDDDRRFQSIARRLPDGVEPVRLYESYLTNFSFTNGE